MEYPYKKMKLPKELAAMKETGKLDEKSLHKISCGGVMWLWAAISFNFMYDEAKKAGIKLKNIGDYRPYAVQLRMFEERYSDQQTNRVPEVTRKWNGKTYYLRKGKSPSSTPGTSNHGHGLAIDINVKEKGVAEWLCANAPKYGFYLQGSDPKSPNFELWHWQYVEGDSPTPLVKEKWKGLLEFLAASKKS